MYLIPSGGGYNYNGRCDPMTSKELLYLEDALGNEKYFQSKCKETASQLQDIELKTCIEQMAQKHQQIFQRFYGLL